MTDPAEGLQHGLDIYYSYCKQWKLNVNIIKTKIMIFGKGSSTSGVTLFYDNNEVEIVASFKYLGVYSNRSGSFCTIKLIYEQANKALHLISSHLSPLTLEVVRAPQMTLQQYLSILPCLPLPSENLQTPFLSIPWCYLPIPSSFFLSFLLLSLSPAELSSRHTSSGPISPWAR